MEWSHKGNEVNCDISVGVHRSRIDQFAAFLIKGKSTFLKE